jgi:hypothetical protein
MKWLTAAMTAVILAPGAGGLWLASAHDQPLPASQEKQDKPMKLYTADAIVAGKIEGAGPGSTHRRGLA